MLQFQQRIALLYGAAGFSRDSGIVIGVADNERRGHALMASSSKRINGWPFFTLSPSLTR